MTLYDPRNPLDLAHEEMVERASRQAGQGAYASLQAADRAVEEALQKMGYAGQGALSAPSAAGGGLSSALTMAPVLGGASGHSLIVTQEAVHFKAQRDRWEQDRGSPSLVVELVHLCTPAIASDEPKLAALRNSVQSELVRFGTVVGITVRVDDGTGRAAAVAHADSTGSPKSAGVAHEPEGPIVTVRFGELYAARAAQQAMNGRFFDERQIRARFGSDNN